MKIFNKISMSNTIKPELGTKYGIDRMLWDSVTEYDASHQNLRMHTPTVRGSHIHPGSPICPGCFCHTGKPHYPCCPLSAVKAHVGAFSHYSLGPHARPHYDPLRPENRTMSLESLHASSFMASAVPSTPRELLMRRGSNSSLGGVSIQTDYGERPVFAQGNSTSELSAVHPRVASLSRHSSIDMGSSFGSGSISIKPPMSPKRHYFPYEPPDASYHTFSPKFGFKSKS